MFFKDTPGIYWSVLNVLLLFLFLPLAQITRIPDNRPPNKQSAERGTEDLCSEWCCNGFLLFLPGIQKDGSFVRAAACNYTASLNFYGDHFCLLHFVTAGEAPLFQFFLPEWKALCPVANYYMGRSCFECRLPLLRQIIPVYSTKDTETLERHLIAFILPNLRHLPGRWLHLS